MELDLKELIDRLWSIYKQFGNTKVVINTPDVSNLPDFYIIDFSITDINYSNLTTKIIIEEV